MQITSVKTKEADPNPQQARYEVFRVRIACVITSSTDPEQPTIRNAKDLPQVTFVRTEKIE
jgi:hypothetical protein